MYINIPWSGVCPGCGRCQTCGRPKPAPVAPYQQPWLRPQTWPAPNSTPYPYPTVTWC